MKFLTDYVLSDQVIIIAIPSNQALNTQTSTLLHVWFLWWLSSITKWTTLAHKMQDMHSVMVEGNFISTYVSGSRCDQVQIPDLLMGLDILHCTICNTV